MPGRHDVYVFDVGRSYKVRPAMCPMIAGKRFSVRNLTNETLTLEFPRGLMRLATPGTIAPHRSKSFHIDKHANGLYRYQITVVRKGSRHQKARGESDPEMIVDP